jgi:hypothetical protein
MIAAFQRKIHVDKASPIVTLPMPVFVTENATEFITVARL